MAHASVAPSERMLHSPSESRQVQRLFQPDYVRSLSSPGISFVDLGDKISSASCDVKVIRLILSKGSSAMKCVEWKRIIRCIKGKAASAVSSYFIF
jgi:hypothetical protein